VRHLAGCSAEFAELADDSKTQVVRKAAVAKLDQKRGPARLNYISFVIKRGSA
jgi:hypothetical protein